MEVDDVSLDPTDYGSNTGILYYEVLARYLKPAKLCFRTNLKYPCYAYSNPEIPYKNMTGKVNLASSLFDDGQIALLDGTLFIMESPAYYRTWIFVDLNGCDRLPNRLGYDVFVFQFLDGELRTMGDKNTAYTDHNVYCSPTSNDEYNGISCAQKAKENSDYFKTLVKYIK